MLALTACLPACSSTPLPLAQAPAAIELLRLSAFFGNAALTAQLGEHLCARVAAGEGQRAAACS